MYVYVLFFFFALLNFHLGAKLFAHELQKLKSKIVYQAKRLAKCLPCQFSNSLAHLRWEEVLDMRMCLRKWVYVCVCVCAVLNQGRCSGCLAIKSNDKCKCYKQQHRAMPGPQC